MMIKLSNADDVIERQIADLWDRGYDTMAIADRTGWFWRNTPEPKREAKVVVILHRILEARRQARVKA